MEIYIETFLLQNIIINFCLLKLVASTTKFQTSFFKLLLSSVIGSAFSVISAVFITNTLIINLIKLICAIAMIKFAFKTTIKQFIISFILLFSYTFCLGGAIINLSSATYQTSFGIITKSKFNLTTICLIIIALSYTIELVAKHQKYRLKTNNYIFPVELCQNNQKIKINAYLDSGNLLQFNDRPVIILDLNCYLKLTNTDLINFYLNSNVKLQTNTVTGSQNLNLFKLDKIIIYNNKQKIELNNQYVAINTKNSFKNTNYQALLSPLML